MKRSPEKRNAVGLPVDQKGRILWERIEGFIPFMQTEAARLTNTDLLEAIDAKWKVRPSKPAIENLRLRYGAYMDEETRRRSYDQRTAQRQVAEMAVPNFVRQLGPKDRDYFVKVEGDVLVTSDWHCPYQDEELVSKLFDVAKQLKITQLIINGDFLNQDAFSKWKHHRFNIPWPAEKEAARGLVKRLFERFERIYYILDNHDRRLLAANEVRTGGLDESDVIELMTYGLRSGKLRASVDYHYTIVNGIFRVTSPKEYRRVKLSLPNRLAQLYHQNIISGGDHLFAIGLDDSGHYVIANDMCIVNREEVPYVMTADSTYPHWNSGFYAIIDNVLYPFCNHPNLWPKWPEWMSRQRKRPSI